MSNNKITAPSLLEIKARGEKISVLTAYDYTCGQLVDEAGIDVALVGDSLGMVVLGYDNTLQVTMEDMLCHTAAVARGTKRALVVGDMPFLSYQVSDEEAVRNAGRFIQIGAQAIKLEGGEQVAQTIKKIVGTGIPVMGHVGMTPQSVYQMGGFKIQGRDSKNAERILNDALAVQEAGAFAVVLEAIPAALAKNITQSLVIPTIGIGAGPDCDGHVLVSNDMLGLFDKFVPSYVKQYANIRQTMLDAFKSYNSDTKASLYPERKK